MIRFTHGVATSVGRVRRVNEDSFVAQPPLFAVADGMGGHGSGDLASSLAAQALTRCAGLRPLFVEAVLAALEEANRVIIARDEATRMGTTITGLAGLETAGGDQLMVFNVGDSRVYRLGADRVEQVTTDHSQVQELVLAGLITPEQARTHPRRNVVTRALGSAAALRVDHWLLPVIAGDRFLICSDGLFGELPDAVILPLLAVGSPQHAAQALVAAANDAGGHDNVTAVVVDINPPAPGTALAPGPLSSGRGAPGGWGALGGRSAADGRDIPDGRSAADGRSLTDGRGAPGGRGAPWERGGPAGRGAPHDVGLAGLGLAGPDPADLTDPGSRAPG